MLASRGEDPNSDTSALTYGVARGATLSLNDEITGIGAAIGGAFSGQNPIESYQVYRDLVRRQTERTREESPYLSYGGEIAGALLTGGRGFGGVNTVKDAAKVGVIEGGIYGFGEGEGAAGSALGAGVGGLTGGTVGAGVQRGVSALAARQANRAAQAAPVVEAAQRRGLTENIRGADIDPNLRGPRAQLMQGQNRETLRGVERDDLDAMQDALMRELGGVNASNAGGNQARGDAIQQAMADDPEQDEKYGMAHGGMACGCGGGEDCGCGGLMTDPVSGNEIPIGSSAENVRDDIEIMISEGEYVLPADVVKWHGLKHIMDMEAEAKMGLMGMYAQGLIQYVDEEGSVEEEVEEAEEVIETPEGNEVEMASVEVTEEEPEVNETEEYQESEYGTKTSLYGMMKPKKVAFIS